MRSAAIGSTRGHARSVHVEDYQSGWNFFPELEYASSSGKTLDNLRPDSQGLLEIDTSQLTGYSSVVVYVSDAYGSVMKKINIGNSSYENRDLRLEESKPAGIIYTEERFGLQGSKDNNVTVTDLAGTQITVLENLKDIFEAMETISTLSPGKMGAWKFLVNWDTFSSEEKLEKLDEFGGHELNIFCYLRDQEFFNKFILPILGSKSKLELIDHILLG